MLKLILIFVRVIIVYFFDSVTNNSLVVYNSFRCDFIIYKNYVSFGNGFYKIKYIL